VEDAPAVPHVTALDTLAFAAELALLAGLALGGWAVGGRWPVSAALAVALPVAAAVVWGAWCAPRAARRLPTRSRWAVKSGLFVATSVLLVVAGPRPVAPILAAVMLVAFAVSLPADRGA
jgi:hypothetical protein